MTDRVLVKDEVSGHTYPVARSYFENYPEGLTEVKETDEMKATTAGGDPAKPIYGTPPKAAKKAAADTTAKEN